MQIEDPNVSNKAARTSSDNSALSVEGSSIEDPRISSKFTISSNQGIDNLIKSVHGLLSIINAKKQIYNNTNLPDNSVMNFNIHTTKKIDLFTSPFNLTGIFLHLQKAKFAVDESKTKFLMNYEGLFIKVFCRFSDLSSKDYLFNVELLNSILEMFATRKLDQLSESNFDLFLDTFDQFFGGKTEDFLLKLASGLLNTFHVAIISHFVPNFSSNKFKNMGHEKIDNDTRIMLLPFLKNGFKQISADNKWPENVQKFFLNIDGFLYSTCAICLESTYLSDSILFKHEDHRRGRPKNQMGGEHVFHNSCIREWVCKQKKRHVLYAENQVRKHFCKIS